MSKTDKKYKGFREFYEDEEVPRKKTMKDSKKNKLKFVQKVKNFDPKMLADDEDFFDELDGDYK